VGTGGSASPIPGLAPGVPKNACVTRRGLLGVANAWKAPGGNRGIGPEWVRRQQRVLSARSRSRLSNADSVGMPCGRKPPAQAGVSASPIPGLAPGVS
jgi:hypothetical protein